MKIVALITARLGSTRLSRKHLLPVSGKPIMQYLVDAIRREFSDELASGDFVVSIATSEEPENREFESAIAGCGVFYGSPGNIPLRHLQAAEFYGAHAILSIDGDDILCSPRAMRAVLEALESGSPFAKTEGLPLGMNASGYARQVLKDALERSGEKGLLETGWGRIFEGVKQTAVHFECTFPELLRFTLDYDEDYKFFTRLLAEPDVAEGRLDCEGIVGRVLDLGLEKITQPIAEEYWRNFYSHVDKEKQDQNA